jgi:alpha-beta hydrolase superfamily lysophospholipase
MLVAGRPARFRRFINPGGTTMTGSARIAHEERIEGPGGIKIFTRSWRPDSTPRAVVVICHGVNSHGGQYTWTAGQLAAAGYVVYALDLRGRGQSEGKRFYVEHVRDYVGDLRATVKFARSREPGLPVFVLGHSAGGVVSCTYALDHQSEIAGLICESFAFQVPAPDLALSTIAAISRVAPNLPVLKLKNEDFSRDPKAVEVLNADPFTQNETQPARTVAALFRADQRLKREFPKITLPVFIMHGTADKATRSSGSQFFYDTAGSKDKTLKLYEGHVHDLLNDIGKEAVMADIKGWIERRVPAP